MIKFENLSFRLHEKTDRGTLVRWPIDEQTDGKESRLAFGPASFSEECQTLATRLIVFADGPGNRRVMVIRDCRTDYDSCDPEELGLNCPDGGIDAVYLDENEQSTLLTEIQGKIDSLGTTPRIHAEYLRVSGNRPVVAVEANIPYLDDDWDDTFCRPKYIVSPATILDSVDAGGFLERLVVEFPSIAEGEHCLARAKQSNQWLEDHLRKVTEARANEEPVAV